MSADPVRAEDSAMSDAVATQPDAPADESVEERLDRLEREHEELQAELEAEREQRQALESIIEIRGAEDAAEADLAKIWIAGNPAGKFIADNKAHRTISQGILFGFDGGNDLPEQREVRETMTDTTPVYESLGTNDSSGSQHRELPFPLYRMLADLQDGQDAGLDIGQKRAARLFERFVNKVKDVEGAQNVSTDGQKYTMTTEQAIGVLEDEGLLDIKKQSKSKTVGRVMREVQRFTIIETEAHEDCDTIDKCSDHGVIHFRPGKPHTLTIPKGQMKGVVINASPSDKDVRATDDGESGGNSPEEGSADEEFERLSEATPVTSDD